VKDLSLHILDVVENSVRAEAKLVEISVTEDLDGDVFVLRIEDDGKGMETEARLRAADPFFTTKSGRRFGMGLALLAQATREAEGKFEISTGPGAGTKIKATFRHSHPDRKPLGDIPATLEALVAGNPGVSFVFEHRKGAEVTRFDSRRVTKP
jgi:signal transduction histidine kinase